MTATKHDSGKLRYDLIPPEAMSALASILTAGAARYGERNWEAGFDWGRLFGAAQRHLWQFWAGEDVDPESGQPHLHHALANLAFLVAHQDRRLGRDDRYLTGEKS